MSEAEALLRTLKGLAKRSLSYAEGEKHPYPKGLYEGSALAYEVAAQALQVILEEQKKLDGEWE